MPRLPPDRFAALSRKAVEDFLDSSAGFFTEGCQARRMTLECLYRLSNTEGVSINDLLWWAEEKERNGLGDRLLGALPRDIRCFRNRLNQRFGDARDFIAEYFPRRSGYDYHISVNNAEECSGYVLALTPSKSGLCQFSEIFPGRGWVPLCPEKLIEIEKWKKKDKNRESQAKAPAMVPAAMGATAHSDAATTERPSADEVTAETESRREMSVGGGSQPPLYNPKQYVVSTPGHRLHFGALPIDLVGRQNEKAELEAFLNSADRRFAWWVLTGPAGVGKSKLALEAACASIDTWEWGFLDQEESSFSWNQWQPQRPTFIIVDEPSRRPAAETRRLLFGFCRAQDAFKHPVRVLLIHRHTTGVWWDEFNQTDKSHHVEAARYQRGESPRNELLLKPLSLDDQCGIIRALCKQSGGEVPEEHEITGLLEEMKIDRRPLFAAMCAYAIIEKAGVDMMRHWNEEDLQRYVLRKELDLWKAEGARDVDLDLLALATLCSGLNGTEDKTRIQVEALLGHESLAKSTFSWMYGCECGDHVRPLEPDLLGEFFVMTHLAGMTGFRKGRLLEIMNAAWSINWNTVMSTVGHMMMDFPEHPAVTPLFCAMGDATCGRSFWPVLASLFTRKLVGTENLADAETVIEVFRRQPTDLPDDPFLLLSAVTDLVVGSTRAGDSKRAQRWYAFLSKQPLPDRHHAARAAFWSALNLVDKDDLEGAEEWSGILGNLARDVGQAREMQSFVLGVLGSPEKDPKGFESHREELKRLMGETYSDNIAFSRPTAEVDYDGDDPE